MVPRIGASNDTTIVDKEIVYPQRAVELAEDIPPADATDLKYIGNTVEVIVIE